MPLNAYCTYMAQEFVHDTIAGVWGPSGFLNNLDAPIRRSPRESGGMTKGVWKAPRLFDALEGYAFRTATFDLSAEAKPKAARDLLATLPYRRPCHSSYERGIASLHHAPVNCQRSWLSRIIFQAEGCDEGCSVTCNSDPSAGCPGFAGAVCLRILRRDTREVACADGMGA